jgi:hypothetical protein
MARLYVERKICMSLSALDLLKSGSVQKNAAIARCCKAWQLRYSAGRSKGEDEVLAAHHADGAYRDAMPALDGYNGIRDFIVCAAHGMLVGAILCQHGTRFLYAAQVALGALNRQPAKPPGRPKKITK